MRSLFRTCTRRGRSVAGITDDVLSQKVVSLVEFTHKTVKKDTVPTVSSEPSVSVRMPEADLPLLATKRLRRRQGCDDAQ